mgnify:CR=1 FL=1
MSNEAKVTIIRSNRKTLSIELKPNEIIARAPARMKEKEIYKFIESKKSWIDRHLTKLNERQKVLNDLQPYTQEEIKEFTAKAKLDIPKRVEFYAEKIGVTYNRITIRHQKTRWGSCTSSGNLNFNCLLVLFPEEVLDSIVVHELCHRKQMNHSAKFYAEIEKVFPDYNRCRQWLKQNGNKYMSRIPK